MREYKTKCVSVIVPVYNSELYLGRCLDSVIKQTYRDLQIILVDDGSPDNSSEIAECWMKKDSRIKVYHKKNGGLSDARNVGIDKSKGDYISFVDSDDTLEDNFLEEAFSLINGNDLDLVIGGYNEVKNGDVVKMRKCDE